MVSFLISLLQSSNKCPTSQSYPNRSDSTGLRAQSQKTALMSHASCKYGVPKLTTLLSNLATKSGCLPLILTQEPLSSQGWSAPTSQPGMFPTSALRTLSLKKVFMEASYVCRIIPLVINLISSHLPSQEVGGMGLKVPTF